MRQIHKLRNFTLGPARYIANTLAAVSNNSGFPFQELRRYEEAIADLTRAIDLNPNDPRYYGQRFPVYVLADHMDLAQAEYKMYEDLRNQGHH